MVVISGTKSSKVANISPGATLGLFSTLLVTWMMSCSGPQQIFGGIGWGRWLTVASGSSVKGNDRVLNVDGKTPGKSQGWEMTG